MRYILLIMLLIGLARGADDSGPGDSASIQDWHDLETTEDGDTYTMGADTYGWGPSKLVITKAVTIKGSGRTSTFIEDNSDNPVGKQETVTINHSSGVVRLSDFTIGPGTRSTAAGSPFGIIYATHPTGGVSAKDSDVRFVIERVTVEPDLNGRFISSQGMFGVVADVAWTREMDIGVQAYANKLRDDAVTDNGDAAYYNLGGDPDFSGDLFIFLENCTFDYTGGSTKGLCDGEQGVRFMARHNTFVNSRLVNHGAETGKGRSGSVIIAHDNEFRIATGGNANLMLVEYRGGTGFCFNNEATDYSSTKFSISVYRHTTAQNLGGWGAADGTNPWDNNDPANPHDSGTAEAGSGLLHLVDTTKNWDPDQWIGYTVKRQDTGSLDSAYIESNTETELFLKDGKASGGPAPAITINEGDTYDINLVLEALDQPGVYGGAVVNTRTQAGKDAGPPGGVMGQHDEPLYAWNNVLNETTEVLLEPGGKSIRAGEHFHNPNTTESGSTQSYGVRSGSKAAMLAVTPTALGVGWWVDDEADWDQTSPGVPDGQLYVSISDGMGGYEWGATPHFTPYTYPHPLRTEVTPPDTDPPTPDPMTFAVAPAASGPSSISMTATTATDATTPIKYRVRVDGVTETEWQLSESFTISGLAPSTEYDFEVQACDGAPTPNLTAYSSIASATTNAASTAPPATAETVSAGTLTIIEP